MYLIKTLNKIAKECGVCEMTIRRWTKQHGFPACKLPNGVWTTTTGLIDSWIVARQRAANG